MRDIKKFLLKLTREEYIILLNSIQLYKIAMTYINYTMEIDECNSLIDILYYDMNTKINEEIEVYFLLPNESIIQAINALVVYKKLLSFTNEKYLYRLTNSVISKLNNINSINTI